MSAREFTRSVVARPTPPILRMMRRNGNVVNPASGDKRYRLTSGSCPYFSASRNGTRSTSVRVAALAEGWRKTSGMALRMSFVLFETGLLWSLEIDVRDVHQTTLQSQAWSPETNLNLSGNAWPRDAHEYPSTATSRDSRAKRRGQTCSFCWRVSVFGGDRLLICGKQVGVGFACVKWRESDCPD